MRPDLLKQLKTAKIPLNRGYAAKSWFWGGNLVRALNRGSGARVWLGCVPGALTPTPGLVPLLWSPGLLLVLSLKRGCHGWLGLRLIPGCVPKSWSGRLCGLAAKSWFCRMTLVRLLFFGSAAKSWPLPQLWSSQQVLVPTGSVVLRILVDYQRPTSPT